MLIWIRSGTRLSGVEMERRLTGWKRELFVAHERIAGLFARSEARERSLAYLQGLLSHCERKNGWQLAEWMGKVAPYRMQHLLDWARWDADAARDRLREYMLEELSSPDAVLIADETGFLKKRTFGWSQARVNRNCGPHRKQPGGRVPLLRQRKGRGVGVSRAVSS